MTDEKHQVPRLRITGFGMFAKCWHSTQPNAVFNRVIELAIALVLCFFLPHVRWFGVETFTK